MRGMNVGGIVNGRWVGAAPLVMLVGVAAIAIAGPLEPPSGAVAPTYKTLSEVEPRTAINAANTPGDADSVFRIVQPGSYYLTGNVTLSGDLSAIEVAASDVTIDLGGFTIERTTSGAGMKSLIQYAGGSARNVVVHDGTVRNAGRHGVELGTEGCVRRVRVIGAAGTGIYIAGARGIVEGCTVSSPAQGGIYVTSNSRVIDTTVSQSGGDGIEAATNCEVRSCNVDNAGGHGIQVAFGSIVERCSSRSSGQFGITSNLNSGTALFLHNEVTLNDGGGIRVYGGSRVIGNIVSMSGTTSPCIVVVGDGNRIEANLTSAGSDAVRLEATAEDNVVVSNQAFNPGTGNGFANVNLNANMIGPVQSAGGTIVTTSPYANFSR